MSLRLKFRSLFPAQITATSPLLLVKTGLSYVFSLDVSSFMLSFLGAADAAEAAQLLAAATTSTSFVKTLTAAGPYTVLPDDDVLIVKQTVGAAFTINVNWSTRTKPLRVVDGKADADTHNISIVPTTGQTQMGTVNYTYVIDGRGGSITLTPLPDGTGAY